MRSVGRLHRWELWGLVAVLLMAAAVRLVALSNVPPGLRYDELQNRRMAGRVLAGERPLYFSESWGHEPLFHYAQAVAMALTRECDWSLRLPASLCGLLGVLTAWLVARRLCGARVAILAAAALAVSFWSIFYSRVGLRLIATTPPSCLAIYFLWRGMERPPEQRWSVAVDLITGGLCLGVTFYIYTAARALPLLLPGFALYLALWHRSCFKRMWWGLLVFVVVAALIAAPLFFWLRAHPDLERRTRQLADNLTALKEGNPQPVLYQAILAFGMFVWHGQEDWLYNVYGRPVFDLLAGVCFMVGVLLCLQRWHQARCTLLLIWLGAGLIPAIIVPPAASVSHAIAAQPPAYVLMAVGLEALWRTVQRRWGALAPLLAAGILAVHGANSGYAYFVTWANAPEVCELYQCGITAVARELDAHDPPGPVAVAAPYVDYWNPWNAEGFDLALRREDLSVRWFNPGGAWLWPAETGPATFYIPSDPLGAQKFDADLQALFFADATLLPMADDDFAAFRMIRPAALEARLAAVAESTSLAWSPDLAHLPLPTLPLAFGGRFALLGAEVPDGTVRAGDELRLVTYWQVLTADSTPIVAFVHLTADGFDIWGQHDGLDVRPAELQSGDRFVQVHRVPVRPETPPGVYHFQLGLYGPDTLVRLPILTGEDTTADRVWVGEIRVQE